MNEPVAVFPEGGPLGRRGIQTQLEAFNPKFSIVAETPTAAFRILTPFVLEGIVLASRKLGKPVYLSFIDDKLFVVIADKDSMEAASVGDTTLSELRERVAADIQAMVDLVEMLYLKK